MASLFGLDFTCNFRVVFVEIFRNVWFVFAYIFIWLQNSMDYLPWLAVMGNYIWLGWTGGGGFVCRTLWEYWRCKYFIIVDKFNRIVFVFDLKVWVQIMEFTGVVDIDHRSIPARIKIIHLLFTFIFFYTIYLRRCAKSCFQCLILILRLSLFNLSLPLCICSIFHLFL